MPAQNQPTAIPRVGDQYEHLKAHDIWTVTAVDYQHSPYEITLRCNANSEVAKLGIAKLDSAYRLSMPAQYMLGQHCGGGNNTAVTEEQTELGRPLDVVIEFGADQNIESVGYRFLDYPAPRKLIIACYLAPFNGTANMATAAGGGYDALYGSAADDLRNWQSRVAAVRPGWECNAPNFPWTAGGAFAVNATIPNYIAAFRRYAGFIRERCPGMAIEWNVQWDWPNPESYYPGDDVVDIIATDLYPQQAFHAPYSWADVISRPSSLTWLDSFSAQRGKKMAITEWGTDFDPSDFVPNMFAWVEARKSRIAYHGYWNEAGGPNVGLNQHPGLRAQYNAAWGVAP